MNPTIRVIVAPGEYCATEGAMTGAQTLQFLSQFTADYTLLGASGIAADGPSEALIDSGTVYRAMIQRAAKSIVVADHSKFDLTYPYHYAGWSGISRLITDQPLPDHLATVLAGKRWSWRVVMPTLNSSDPRRYVLPFGEIGLDPLLQIGLGADGRVLPLRPKDLDIFIGLAEKRQAVARPLIFVRQRVSCVPSFAAS
ncbi:Glycerol-3-phosphate regulon repressor [Raoultella terrigena]|uniref:Glycerol-3-phosphate regulon repressor n=1 Tax=Raoultella terrigena TaxID=577 RepID=A0A3P8IYX8_RAOTE|nr:Glycerol-3-phosphate regulon repressor [Raoultella terrigena]